MKTCVTCRWSEFSWRVPELARCVRPGLGSSPVTGDPLPVFCEHERERLYRVNGCGADGEYWEARPLPPWWRFWE